MLPNANSKSEILNKFKYQNSNVQYWIFNPIPWIQMEKGRLKTDKIPLTPALSPPIFVAGRGLR